MAAPPPLFVYGTLRDPDILAAVLGRVVPPADIRPARAAGMKAVHFPDRLYPALVVAPQGAAEGLLVGGLTLMEADVLDAFEGSEYQRRAVVVFVDDLPVPAEAYWPTVDIPASAKPWSLKTWQRNHKSLVLVEESATASAIRARLMAQNPIVNLPGEL